MKVKEDIKQKLRNILLAILVTTGIILLIVPNVIAAAQAVTREGDGFWVNGNNEGEVFDDYKMNKANGSSQPSKLFAPEDIYMFCGAKGHVIGAIITAPKKYFTAWQEEKASNTYNPDAPVKYYNREGVKGGKGLRETYKAKYLKWRKEQSDKGNCSADFSVTPYQGDDQKVINQLIAGLPGVNKDPVKSIYYKKGKAYSLSDDGYIAGAFIVTQQKRYKKAVDIPEDGDQAEVDGHRSHGWFSIAEKQSALWSTLLNKTKTPAGNNRNLADIALGYEKFYKDVIKGAGYGSLIKAHKVEDKQEVEIKDGGIDGLEAKKTIKYNNTNLMVDTSGSYILGPFKVDYAHNTTNGDAYTTTDGYEVKFNAIKKITVYNQNKQDITGLGASFKIVDKATGESMKLLPIIDDGDDGNGTNPGASIESLKIDAFKSGEEFYVVVDKGSMSVDQFTKFYAKIDLEYLKEVKANLYEYEATVKSYGYKAESDTEKSPNYYATYCNTSTSTPTPTPEDPNPSSSTSHNKTRVGPKTFDMKTWTYELERKDGTGDAQRMIGYDCQGARTYEIYPIILTTDWDEQKSSQFEIEKVCSETGKKLYGAEFEITVSANGKKAGPFTRKTNSNGKIIITSAELASQGLGLAGYTGEVTVDLKETKAPAGHEIIEGNRTENISCNKGELNGNITITVKDRHKEEPKIQIAKKNKDDGKPIEGASFKIHVTYYKDGKTHNEENNIIGGTTEKGGYLNLTVEDFYNMNPELDKKDRLEINKYTGKVMLQIVEVGVPGYSIIGGSLNMTLEFKDGQLTKYSENTTQNVLVHYLYDQPITNLIGWLKDRNNPDYKVYDYVKESVEKWAKEQEEKLKKNGETRNWTYDDILDWLLDYLEEHPDYGNDSTEEWKTSTLSSDKNKGVVQIVIEDGPGPIELPEIPIREQLMNIGGTVFLDRTDKKDGIDRNGKLDNGEQLLYGIEVELHEENGKLAELVKNDEDPYRSNPTVTNENGYYEFRGVDPFKKYYVIFKYNGVLYEATESSEVGYNTDDWAKTSKGYELDRSGFNGKFKTIDKNNYAGTSAEIENISIEIAKLRAKSMEGGNFLSLEAAINVLKNNGLGISDDMAKFLKNSEITARAGYSSSGNDGQLYPHNSLGSLLILDNGTVNLGGTPTFGGQTAQNPYPGQTQINLGLILRDVTDLELDTKIVKTTVSMNRYDTEYKYEDSIYRSYHQYIYKEDYNYDTTSLDKDGKQREDGIAYYTEDNVRFFVTYENTIKNMTYTGTVLNQIIDYYNSEFKWAENYTTDKGTYIPGILINGVEPNSKEINNICKNNTTAENGYKRLTVNVPNGNLNSPSDEIKIQITYELVGNSEANGGNANAQEVLKNYLLNQDNTYATSVKIGSTDVTLSNVMEIDHYAEITSYSTTEGKVDRDSHPDNFNISDYVKAIEDYQKAYNSGNAEEARRMKDRMLKMREDDATRVTLTLTNSDHVRTLTGNVWEAVGTANNGSNVKSSLDLQKGYGEDKYMLYNKVPDNQNLEGITVELVELLCNDGQYNDKEYEENQIVRAVTKTDKDGKYEFKSFIAGDYAVRFVYGEENNLHYSQVSTGKEGNIDGLPINGQYYQSTKANPNTAEHKPAPDEGQYWYYNNDKGDREDIKAKETDNKRYSDAYDDAYTRLAQMQTVVVPGNGIDQSTSTVYNFDGNAEVESTRVTDPIYAYTSTMNIEIEYVRPKVTGNKDNYWYKYDISNVDFGVTPRAANDVNVSRHISNVKLYVEGSNEPLIDAYYTESGRRIDSDYIEKLGNKATDTEKELAKKLKGEDFIMDSIMDGNKYIGVNLDYLLKITYESLLAQRAHLELTYAVKVTNDSDKGVTQDGKTVYDTIKYIYALDKNSNSTDRIIGVVYYDENVDKLTSYETVQYYEGDQIKEKGQIMYHNKIALGKVDTLPKENPSNINSNTAVNVRGEDRLQDINSGEGARPSRLINYARLDYSEGKANPIQSKVETIIDYPTAPLDFNGTDKLGNTINADWEETEPSEFVSSRENYKIENNVVSLLGKVGEEDSLMTQSHILKASKDSVLHDRLLPGESRETTLTLQHTLATTTEDISEDSTQDITGNDIEYSNLVEITRLQNDAGKVVDIEGYDVNGRIAGETSQIVRRSDLIHEEMEGVDVDTIKYGNGEQQYSDGKSSRTEFGTQKIHLTPTLSTGKSPTTVINTPAGLSNRDNIFTYTGIAIAVLSLLAGGIVLIKKYVIVKIPKA